MFDSVPKISLLKGGIGSRIVPLMPESNKSHGIKILEQEGKG